MRNHQDGLSCPTLCRQFALLAPILQSFLVASLPPFAALSIIYLKESGNEALIAPQGKKSFVVGIESTQFLLPLHTKVSWQNDCAASGRICKSSAECRDYAAPFPCRVAQAGGQAPQS